MMNGNCDLSPRKDRFVMVGEMIVEAEPNFRAGAGTYYSNDVIRSSMMGNVYTDVVEDKMNPGKYEFIYSVKEPNLPPEMASVAEDPKVGDMITGRVSYISQNFARIIILCVNNLVLKAPLMGILRKEHLGKRDIKLEGLPNCIQPGDIISAQILHLANIGNNNSPYILSMAEDVCGVLKAIGKDGKEMTPLNTYQVIHKESGNTELRKVAQVPLFFYMEEEQQQSEASTIDDKGETTQPTKRTRRSAALKSENTWKNIIHDDKMVNTESDSCEIDHNEGKVVAEIKPEVEVSVKPTRRRTTNPKPRGKPKKNEHIEGEAGIPKNENEQSNVYEIRGEAVKESENNKTVVTGNAPLVSAPSVKRKGRSVGVTKGTNKLPNVLVVKQPGKTKKLTNNGDINTSQNKTFNITPDMKQRASSPGHRHVINVTNSSFSVVNTSQSHSQKVLKSRINQIVQRNGTKVVNGQTLQEANKLLEEMCSIIETLCNQSKIDILNAEQIEKNLKANIQLQDNKISSLTRRISSLEHELIKISRQKHFDMVEGISLQNNVSNEITENSGAINLRSVGNEYNAPIGHGDPHHMIHNPIPEYSSAYNNINSGLITNRPMSGNNNDAFVISKPPQRHGGRIQTQEMQYYLPPVGTYQQPTYTAPYGMGSLDMEREIMGVPNNSMNVNNIHQLNVSGRSVIEKNGVTYQDL
uniref:S1 motif domain-containing protein n=1 Tax=Parastrongyloides trichosuri TaxID=131310 RepID=A0A0N4Z1A7_PARTI